MVEAPAGVNLAGTGRKPPANRKVQRGEPKARLPAPSARSNPRAGVEGVASLHIAALQPVLKPALALLGGAVRERVRDRIALRLLLQAVIADRGRRAHRGFDIARLDRLPSLVGLRGPDAGEAVGLQLDFHLEMIGVRLAHALLLLLHLGKDAELVLHVMADLVRHHIGLCELAGARARVAAAEAALEIAEEGRIEINLLVGRAVERAHRGLRHAALIGARRAGEHHQRRGAVALAALLEHVLPDDLGRAEDARHELAHLVARRAGLAGGLGLLLLVSAAAADHLSAADQQARVDAERVADDAENDDGADAETTATERETKAAPAASAIAAAIFDVVALRQIIKPHSFLLSPRSVFADLNR